MANITRADRRADPGAVAGAGQSCNHARLSDRQSRTTPRSGPIACAAMQAHWQFTYAMALSGHSGLRRAFAMTADCAGRQLRLGADRPDAPHPGRRGVRVIVQRLVALAFLTHFIGDIHQPLHVGDHGDRGGNEVTVVHQPLPLIGDQNRPESLHWFWDTLPEPALAGAGHRLVRVYTPAERARIATGDVADWARESYVLARSVAYAHAFHHDPCVGSSPHEVDISQADVQAMLPIVRQRLTQAGLRLARVLDQALAS